MHKFIRVSQSDVGELERLGQEVANQVLGFSDTGNNILRTNYFEINFDVSVKLLSNDDQRIIKRMNFNDRVFSQNMYLRSI